MRKMLLCLSAGYAGTDTHEAWLIPEEVTDEEMGDIAWERALDHAESYGIYPTNDAPEDYDTDEYEGGDEYTDDIEGCFRPFEEGKDDGKVLFGGSREIEWIEW